MRIYLLYNNDRGPFSDPVPQRTRNLDGFSGSPIPCEKNLTFSPCGCTHTKEFISMAQEWREHFGRKPPCQFGCESLVGHADIGIKMGTMYLTLFAIYR